MLLERFAYMSSLLNRQIVDLIVCDTIVNHKLIQFLRNTFKHRHIWTIVFVFQHRHIWTSVFIFQRGYRPKLKDQENADSGM